MTAATSAPDPPAASPTGAGVPPGGPGTTGDGVTPLAAPVVVDITAPILPPDSVVIPPGPGPVAVAVGGGEAAAPAEPAPTAGPPGEAAPSGPPGAQPRTERRHQRRRNRRLLAAIVVVAVLLLATAGWAGARRINGPLAVPAVHSGVPASLDVPGAPPALPWPGKGQGAVSIPALGYAQQSGPESSVPIASLTKMTNALVVLRDHPVPAGSSGPSITITAADVAEYDIQLHNDQSTVPIHTGEVLTEVQMLEALLTQSANDMAYSLAVWDAGSEPAFVAKMNALAASLGATNSHYVDASGYEPGSVSTASDVLRVAAAGMLDPTFAQIVGMSSIDFPGVGTLPNVVSEIGKNGVIGVKSGYTSKAGGCLVLAADRVVAGHTALVLVAVLGQPTPPPIVPKTTTTTAPRPAPTTTTAPPAPGVVVPPTTPPPPTTTVPPTTTTTIPVDDLQVPDPLKYTRPVAEGLLASAQAGVVPVAVATKGAAVGTATAVWGGRPHPVSVVAADSASLLGWPGQQVVAMTSLRPVRAGGPRGSPVGSARFTLGSQSESVPLTLAATVPEPSWWWRLLHN